MKINEVAKLTGITVRTLHYYDEIGLLKPNGMTESGYRLYDRVALETLQQILFFRELDFSLSQIKEIMTDPHYDKRQALAKHKVWLLQKRDRLNALVDLVDRTLKGEEDMSFKQFDRSEIESSKAKYAAEVKARWGETEAFAESEVKTASYDDARWKTLNEESEALLQAFSDHRGLSPECSEVQALVEKWQAYITAHFYTCTKEILAGLGQMYIGDERFKANIDRHGEGTAALMAAAIEVYAGK